MAGGAENLVAARLRGEGGITSQRLDSPIVPCRYSASSGLKPCAGKLKKEGLETRHRWIDKKNWKPQGIPVYDADHEVSPDATPPPSAFIAAMRESSVHSRRDDSRQSNDYPPRNGMKRTGTPDGRIQEAKSALESGQFDEALRLSTAICDSDPANPGAWSDRGNALFLLARYKESAESFQKAVELDGGNSEAWVALGNARRLDGEPQRAIEPLEHALKLAPGNADAWFLLGLSLDNVGEFVRSVDAFDKAFKLDPEFSKNAERLRHRAESLTDAGRPAEAILLLDLGLELIKNAKQESAEQKATEQDLQGQLLLQKGLALNALERFDEGVVALQQSASLLRGDPEKSLALLHEGLALTELHQPQEALAALEKAAALAPQNWIAGRIGLGQGVIYSNLSKHAEAEVAFNRALEFLPPEGPLAWMRSIAWFHKGIALNSLSRFGEAIEAFDKMSETGAELPPRVVAMSWFHKGVALNSLSRFSEAIDAFDKMSKAGTDLPADVVAVACFHKGRAQNRLGLATEALATFAISETQLLQGPLAPAVCSEKALAFGALGQWKEALSALTEASETEKRPGAIQIPAATLSSQKAIALNNLGRFPEAITALDEATKADPALLEDVHVWKTRAFLCFQTGGLADVIAEPPKVLADHPLVLALQGNAFVALDRLPEAWTTWQKASSPEGTARSEEADAWVGFGMCRPPLQQPGEGLEALDRAVRLNPGLAQDPSIQMLRATCLTALGRHEQSLEAAKGALDIEPVWLLRGMSLAALKRNKEALEAFDQGISVGKKSLVPVFGKLYIGTISLQKGLVLLGTEQTSLALEAFEQGIQSGLNASNPSYIMSVLGKGWALEKLKSPGEAEKFLLQASQLSEALPDSFPYRGVAWWSYGEFLMRRERQEEAVQAFTQSLELEPKNAGSLLGRGRAFMDLEDFEQAEVDYTKAQDIAKNDQEMFDALLGRGQSLSRLNRNEEAVSTYRRAVKFLSKDVHPKWRVWLSFGEAYQELGRQQAALRAYQQGWRQDEREKKSSDLAVGISAMLLETKREEEALTFLQEAKRKAESDGRIDYNLGLAYYRRQEPEKAREAWTDAAKKKITQAEVCLRAMETKHGAVGGWIECWFGADRTKSRKFIGGLLVSLLALTCALPLLKKDALPWFNTGQDWTVTVTAVVMLAVLFLLPAIKRLSLRKDSLEIEMEPERPETSPLGPSADSLLSRLAAIGLSLQGGGLSPGQMPGNLQARGPEDDLLKQVLIPGSGTLPAGR